MRNGFSSREGQETVTYDSCPRVRKTSNILRTNHSCTNLLRHGGRRALVLLGAALFLCPSLFAEEVCPVEVKLLLSPSTIEGAINSLKFGKESSGHVYFFDTDALDLLRQGAIVRVRQGADNDLTVKVRIPRGENHIDAVQIHEHFPCEIDRNGSGENTSFSVRRKYRVAQVAEKGSEIAGLLSPEQRKLLREAGVTIDWTRVARIANIDLTKWEAVAQPNFRKLALELWKWPSGTILEISAKVSPKEGQAGYLELQRLANQKGLALSASQTTKTRTVLEAVTGHTSQ